MSHRFLFLLLTDCLNYEALHLVSKSCYGKQKCVVAVSNQTFRDPCFPGTRKYLAVVYSCGTTLVCLHSQNTITSLVINLWGVLKWEQAYMILWIAHVMCVFVFALFIMWRFLQWTFEASFSGFLSADSSHQLFLSYHSSSEWYLAQISGLRLTSW